MSAQKLTVLLAPMNFVGPINASIGIAEVLRDSGHRVVFAVDHKWRGKLRVQGFEEEVIDVSNNEDNAGAAEHYAQLLSDSGLLSPLPALEKAKKEKEIFFKAFVEEQQNYDSFYGEIVNRVKPNVIIVDNVVYVPALMNCGIPWVWSISCNPLRIDYALDDPRLPPSGLGLATNGDRNVWEKSRKELNDCIHNIWVEFNAWLQNKGIPSLPENKLMKASPHLNVYMFPKELDYTDVRQLPTNWYQFDCFKRKANEKELELPEIFRNKSGQLIYLSLGSMGSADVNLMRRLVSILSKSEHKFIVSKGPNHNQYELADNMWGQEYLPQINVLPIVDLVISHGGNNTITESLFFGLPLIVMPLFLDQCDNAQRVQEKGFGIRLNPYNLSASELLGTIDKLLKDRILAEKLAKLSERIQSERRILRITEMIENLIQKPSTDV